MSRVGFEGLAGLPDISQDFCSTFGTTSSTGSEVKTKAPRVFQPTKVVQVGTSSMEIHTYPHTEFRPEQPYFPRDSKPSSEL